GVPGEGGGEIKVEISQGLVDRIASKAESTTEPPGLSRFVLQLQEPFQDLRGGQLLSQSPVQFDAQMLFRGGEPEIGEVLPEPLIRRRLAHSAATSYSARSRTWTYSPRRRCSRSMTRGAGLTNSSAVPAETRGAIGVSSWRSSIHASPTIRPVVRWRRVSTTTSIQCRASAS